MADYGSTKLDFIVLLGKDVRYIVVIIKTFIISFKQMRHTDY